VTNLHLRLNPPTDFKNEPESNGSGFLAGFITSFLEPQIVLGKT